ncbi:MAG: class I SAM-dependent methyltransferase [Chloroflexota bacterium]
MTLLGPRPGETLLEIGSGTGRELAVSAQRVGEAGRACGIDLSRGMLRRAQRNLGQKKLQSRVALIQADAAFLPLASQSFDAALACFTLELFPEDVLPIVLGEIGRVLRPQGRLCVAALSRSGRANLIRTLYQWGHEHFPGLLDCRPILVRESLEVGRFRVVESRRPTG